ncbi:MAG: hypothetical protein Ct9H300mP23_00490 [Nitrospinota bacterium]|nr:MAG: hypothetical protein Ct9H300mP23_00490 [Nitrospinota bacterium]
MRKRTIWSWHHSYDQRIENPLMNIGGDFQEITWDEALRTIADRMQTTVNRSGPNSLAAIGPKN